MARMELCSERQIISSCESSSCGHRLQARGRKKKTVSGQPVRPQAPVIGLLKNYIQFSVVIPHSTWTFIARDLALIYLEEWGRLINSPNYPSSISLCHFLIFLSIFLSIYTEKQLHTEHTWCKCGHLSHMNKINYINTISSKARLQPRRAPFYAIKVCSNQNSLFIKEMCYKRVVEWRQRRAVLRHHLDLPKDALFCK